MIEMFVYTPVKLTLLPYVLFDDDDRLIMIIIIKLKLGSIIILTI